MLLAAISLYYSFAGIALLFPTTLLIILGGGLNEAHIARGAVSLNSAATGSVPV